MTWDGAMISVHGWDGMARGRERNVCRITGQPGQQWDQDLV